MARQKAKFGRRVIQSPEDIPDHLKHFANLDSVPLGNLTIDDYVWLGDDGKLDPQSIVNEVTAPAALLRLVVQAIVGGNPSTKSAEDRVEAAMRALLGTGGPKGRRPLHQTNVSYGGWPSSSFKASKASRFLTRA